ncbi:MAG TPA: dTDP-glucose 4,6-dehydratase [Acidimicrobiales bacterium]|nr:dTDP-glucose 4,6-dehydratase [Acidimicrobiales bacterium]
MRLFVTGGAGFIGSNYVRRVLSTTDARVTAYDALTYAGNRETVADLVDDPRFTLVQGDVRDRPAVEAAMAGHDTVVHFAAETHVDRSIVGPEAFVSTNCGGTEVVMGAAVRHQVARVVHIGTDEVYGSVEAGSSGEDDLLAPRSPYAASKAGADLIALAHHHTYGLPVAVTRCANNLGPFQHPEKAVPRFTTRLLEGRPVPLYGDGLHQRDWLHVEDHCAAVHLVLERGVPGEIYNVGAGHPIANRELVDRLLALTGRGTELVQPVTDRPGHDRRYAVDSTKVRALGWAGARPLDEALAATVAWYRGNEWWWRPLAGDPR